MSLNKKILSIETSSNICGISYIEGDNCIASVDYDSSKKHTEVLPEYYSRLKKVTGFKLKCIDAIAVSIGPGSFTGLRIGLGFAKGLAFSKELPIIPVSTMMSLAYEIKEMSPKMGLIFSHANTIFSQKIKWENNLPYSDGDIMLLTWDKFLDENEKRDKIFQCNCESKENSQDLMKTKYSSSSVGLYASKNFAKLKVNKPFRLVSNYVAPFKLN